jgi:lysophospholipase L1-like esterase
MTSDRCASVWRDMRRILFWYLPLAVAIFAAIVFATGFYSFVRGDTGTAVAAAPSGGIASRPPHKLVAPLILGDSLARGTGDETGLGIGGRLTAELNRAHVENRPAVNISVNGARTADLVRQLQSRNVQTLIADANVIIISIGGNDLWGSTGDRPVSVRDPNAIMDTVLAHVAGVVHTVRSANPNARIFLVGLYNPFASAPMGSRLGTLVNRWNSKLLEEFAGDPNFTVVPTSDIFSHRDRLSFDRFHPNDEGYAIIARRIADSL